MSCDDIRSKHIKVKKNTVSIAHKSRGCYRRQCPHLLTFNLFGSCFRTLAGILVSDFCHVTCFQASATYRDLSWPYFQTIFIFFFLHQLTQYLNIIWYTQKLKIRLFVVVRNKNKERTRKVSVQCVIYWPVLPDKSGSDHRRSIHPLSGQLPFLQVHGQPYPPRWQWLQRGWQHQSHSIIS